jgi:hypothetical protein
LITVVSNDHTHGGGAPFMGAWRIDKAPSRGFDMRGRECCRFPTLTGF